MRQERRKPNRLNGRARSKERSDRGRSRQLKRRSEFYSAQRRNVALRRTKKRTVRPMLFRWTILVAVVLFAILFFWLNRRAHNLAEVPYGTQILRAAEEHKLNPSLVCAVVEKESSFNPNEVSGVGACGLMQIMPETAEYIAAQRDLPKSYDLFDPETNLDFGCWYLRYLLDLYEVTETALAAYNAGPTIVAEWLRTPEYSVDGVRLIQIPYGETAWYVHRVMELYQEYQKSE